MAKIPHREGIDKVLAAHAYDATDLIGILLEVQALEERRYVSAEAAHYVAQGLSLPVTQVFDCLTFYAGLSTEPRAKYPIQVCVSPACRVNAVNSGRLLSHLESILGVKPGEATADGRFIVERVSCYGACDLAPSLRIGDKVYGHLDSREKIAAVLNDLP